MDFDHRKRKDWPDDGGVSEVVGNILILMITVVLFSGIIAFVQQMPVPEQTIKADFSASISFSGDYTHANLTLIHAGGKVLNTQDVELIIEVDNIGHPYNLTDDPDFTGTTWSTGKAWKMQLDDLTGDSIIVVTVVDVENGRMIWTSQVTGGAMGSPPKIQQRYIDSAPTTPTPDAVKENDTFTLFVKVEDPDGDLESVWIDASGVQIEGSDSPHWDGTQWAVGWYRWNFDKIVYGTVESVDGNVVLIHAEDEANHEAISTYMLEITILPYDTIEEQVPVYTELGLSGLPAYLSFISGALGHGFGFYKELLTDEGEPRGKADTDNPSINFTKDENVFIRFASLTMSNVFVDNRLVITDTRTGLTFTPDYASATPNSTISAPFYPYPTGGGAYVFECAFSTKNLPPSTYTISMYLKNQPGLGQTQQSFAADQMIMVNQEGAPELFMPEVQLFKKGWDESWGSSRDRAFDISSAETSTVYVAIVVQDTQPISPTNPTVAEIRITDLSGGSELYGTPPYAGKMISKIFSLPDGERYNFTIALRLNNGDQWLPGTNAYTLYISRLNDTNEGVYSLSKQLWVKGSQGKADFFAGTSGMAAGNTNFNTREYQFFIQNDNFFSMRIMWQSESTPGANADYTVTALGAGDIDDDGDKDLLMGQATSNLLLMFKNTLNQYGAWQSASSITRPDGITYPITWIAFGDYTGDGHPDFAYSNSNSQIVLYNVTYGSTGWIFNPPAAIKWSGSISKIDLKDMSGDGRADLVVLSGGRIRIYDLKYTYDLALKQYQDPKALFAISTVGAVGTKDFDIEDVNRDGRLDIVTTGTSTAFGALSEVGVNVNLYGIVSESAVLIDETASGFIPRMEYGTHTGAVDSTQAVGGQSIVFTETTSGGRSRVSGIMKFDPLPGNVADQILRVRAIVSPGPDTSESFYVMVSPDNVAYNYVGEISEDSRYQYYNFTLPSSVIGTRMYVKFTDSLTSEDSTPDSIDIDYCAVVAITPGYTGQQLTSTTTWTSARGAELDDPLSTTGWMEVIVAKDGSSGIGVFRRTTGWSAWSGAAPSTDATFYDDCAGKVNDATKYPFSMLAPTLFDAVDINGDGFTDILVCNLTTLGDSRVSRIGFHMNLYTGEPTWRYFAVKTWIIDKPTGSAKDPYIDIVLAAALTAA